MTATLSDSPEMFSFLNNGVTVIANKVEVLEAAASATKEEEEGGSQVEPITNEEKPEDSSSEREGISGDETTIKVTYGASKGQYGDGICNGGHTYYTIEQYQGQLDERATVRVEFIEFTKTDDGEDDRENLDYIIAVARARNAHNSLKSSTEVAFSGGYDKIIEALGNYDKYYKWREGDVNAVKGAQKSEVFIACLCACSPFWFEHFLTGAKGNHMSAARGSSALHNQWIKEWSEGEENRYEKGLDHMLPLIQDIFELVELLKGSMLKDRFSNGKKWRSGRVYQSFKKNCKTTPLKIDLEGYSEGYELPPTWQAMLLGQFRSNVWIGTSGDSEGAELVGWVKEPKVLWNESKEEFVDQMMGLASMLGSVPSFGNAFIQISGLYALNSQLLQLTCGVKKSVLVEQALKPEIIYDHTNGLKYTLKETCADADGESVTLVFENIAGENEIPFIEVVERTDDADDNGVEYLVDRYEE